MVGFWLVEVNPFGPVQLNDVPTSVVPVRLSVAPLHLGELLEAVAEGIALMVMTTVDE